MSSNISDDAIEILKVFAMFYTIQQSGDERMDFRRLMLHS
jgi:hypothetical protein